MLDVPHQEMDVERFIASLPGLAAGRQTLFGELARLAKPETELTVSEHADRYRVVSPESGSPFPGAKIRNTSANVLTAGGIGSNSIRPSSVCSSCGYSGGSGWWDCGSHLVGRLFMRAFA